MFDEQKKLDALYRDYNYALQLVEKYFTAADVEGARCATVHMYLNNELRTAGEPQIDPGLVQRAVKECFNMTCRKCPTPSGEMYLYFRR